MCHVQESSCGISLHAHVPGLCQTREWAECAGFRDLRLVFFMRSEVRDAPDSITLDLNIGRQHLSDERRETSQLNDEDLVLRYEVCQSLRLHCCFGPNLLLTARFPRAALAARCTSISELWSRNSIGSRVSRSTSLTSARLQVSEDCRNRPWPSMHRAGSSHLLFTPPLAACCLYHTHLSQLSLRMSDLRCVVGRCCRRRPGCSGLLEARPRRSRFRRAIHMSILSVMSKGTEKSGHFRGTAGGRRLPPARCQRGRARTGHRGIWLCGD